MNRKTLLAAIDQTKGVFVAWKHDKSRTLYLKTPKADVRFIIKNNTAPDSTFPARISCNYLYLDVYGE